MRIGIFHQLAGATTSAQNSSTCRLSKSVACQPMPASAAATIPSGEHPGLAQHVDETRKPRVSAVVRVVKHNVPPDKAADNPDGTESRFSQQACALRNYQRRAQS